MALGIDELGVSAIGLSGLNQSGPVQVTPKTITDNILSVIGSISTNNGDLSTVRLCSTRRTQPTDISGSQIPFVGVWEEDVSEQFLAGLKRDVSITFRLFCLVQGSDEARARELREFLRRDINFRLYQDQKQNGNAYHTDNESEWVFSTLEDKRMLVCERVMTIKWRESRTGYPQA